MLNCQPDYSLLCHEAEQTGVYAGEPLPHDNLLYAWVWFCLHNPYTAEQLERLAVQRFLYGKGG